MKRIIVTGASKGIGFETSVQLLSTGAEVIAIARSQDELQNLKSHPNSENLEILSLDITTSEGLEQIRKLISAKGNFDGLINNAGLVLNKSFMETADEDWNNIFDVNLFAPVKLIKTLKPFFNKGSHIVNISSMGGFQGSAKFPGLAAYSTAKGALAILTESLSTEFSRDGIVVNCLCLGAVQTQMLEKAFPGYKAPVQPDEMGKFISDFTLNGHKFMNGKILPVSLNNPE